MFRNQRFNIITFLILFGFLYGFYRLLVGVVSPGGRWYSSFLDTYADVPAWLSYFISYSAKALLKLAGYKVYQRAPNHLAIQGSPGVNIIWACLGLGVMSFWTAFVAAHKAAPGYKAKWITAGILFTVLLNIIRIASIALGSYYRWNTYRAIEPHSLFNTVSYICIGLFAALFVYRYKKYILDKKSIVKTGLNKQQ